jgi:hypothetical protein
MTQTVLFKALVAMLFALWHAAAPGVERQRDAREIAEAIATAVIEDGQRTPILSSHAEDAAVAGYYAMRESWLDLDAVGDGGRSRGAWQLQGSAGRAPAVDQARAWLALMHRGARDCRDSPRAGQAPAPATAYAWGVCHALDSLRTGHDIAELARRREQRARRLLQRVLTTLFAD